ncbi:hypothetical protein B0H12DRAFT_299443 [Mycena haematopus]|nr:hypothetical protein B0H12DRAFT_299443 [Mycena haematopus]
MRWEHIPESRSRNVQRRSCAEDFAGSGFPFACAQSFAAFLSLAFLELEPLTSSFPAVQFPNSLKLRIPPDTNSADNYEERYRSDSATSRFKFMMQFPQRWVHRSARRAPDHPALLQRC